MPPAEAIDLKTTVSDHLLSELGKAGARFICGLPAAQIAGVMDGAARSAQFTYVTTRHEEAAAHMAHAIARTTGKIGVCFGTVGPGATNLVPGVAAAWADNIPLLVITGNNPLDSLDPEKDLLQSAKQIELYRPITKWNAQLRAPERAPELIRQAIHIATSGRPGPVHLDVPCDVGLKSIEVAEGCGCGTAMSMAAPDPAYIERAAELLRLASRPLLLAGGGVARSGGVQAFRELLSVTGFPATTTLMGKGAVPPQSPHNIGSGGFLGGSAQVQALQQADVILAVGCKFSTWTLIDKLPLYPRSATQRIIQIDIDPAQIGKAVRVDLGIVSDARPALEKLAARLHGAAFSLDPHWMPGLAAALAAYRDKVAAIADSPGEHDGGINEAAIARDLAGLIDPEAIVAIDGGQTMQWGHTFIHPTRPENLLFNPGMGHLGAGLPFANGAKLVDRSRQVVCITGDGAMGCTIQELETAARCKLNVIIVVFNDSCWGMYKPLGDHVYRNPNFGIHLSQVDFAAVARGFGCHGETVRTLAELKPAFERAKSAERPAVINVAAAFAQHPMDYIWSTIVLRGMEFPQ